MRNRLRISLVIPAYNEESHLADCLTAALAQTEKFHEIIVVDNDSTDATAQIANSFPGVIVVRESRRGIVFARNRGFNTVSGDIIGRIDADTILPTSWAAHIVTFYDNPAHAQAAWTSGGSFRDVPFSGLVSWTYHVIAFTLNRWLTGYPTLWGSSTALPQLLWSSVQPDVCQRTNIHEDLDLTHHLQAADYKIFYDKRMIVSTELRRVTTDRQALWQYLQWWPNTLKLHGQKTWRICWIIGVVPLFIATILFPWHAKLRRFVTTRKNQLLSAFEV